MQKAKYLVLACLLVIGLMASAPLVKADGAAAKKKVSASSSRSKRAKSSRRSRQRGQKAPTSDRISEIQQALAKEGAYNGKPSGKWDAATADAMQKFQAAHGLNPTGKLDAKTLQQLGMGSEIAGVAPPLPPISSSAVPSGSTQATPNHD